MSSLGITDRTSYLALFTGAQGRFGTNISLSVGGVTYSNLALISDDLAFTQKIDLFYDTQVALRQTQAVNFSTYTPPSVSTFYPSFAFGQPSGSVVAQLPFAQTSSFLTSVGENPNGPRFSYAWYGSSAKYPPSYIRSWKLQYGLMTDADIAVLETYFLGQQGRYGTFNFTDPTPAATLSSGIGSGDTSVSISNGFEFPTGAYLTMVTGSGAETMAVTSGSGLNSAATVTVTRAALGTTATSHSAGAACHATFTGVRFGGDDLPIRYLTVNQYSAQAELVQTWH